MNNSRQNNHSFHTNRDRDRDTDGGGFYSGTTSVGSPPTNISSPTTSFYNLQMYSTPSLYTTPSQPQVSQSTSPYNNLYQSVQEVPYHPPVDQRAYPIRSTPIPTASTGSSSSSGMEYNKVHKNGITFVDPFTPPMTAQDAYHHQQHQSRHQQHTHQTHTHSNTISKTSSISKPSNNRINFEPVVQPIYATFGTESIFVTCPYCHNTDSTDVEQAIGSEAILWACIIPFAGFFIKSKWDTRHRCKNCLNVIGVYYP